MAKYPNRAALYEAHNIYRDVMRGFVVRCLKKIQGTTPEKELCRILKLELIDDPKVAIDINDFPRIIRDRDCWFDAFSSLFGSKGDMDIRGMTSVISDSRKLWAHPETEDVHSDSIQMYLSLIAEVLDGIKETDAGHEVKTIRDRLFSDEPEEHPAEVENADLKEHLAEMSDRLAVVKTEKAECEKCLQDAQKRLEDLEEIEAAWMDSEERLTNASNELKKAKAKRGESEKNRKAIVSELEAAKAEKNKLTENLNTTSSWLEDVEKENVELKKNLETTAEEKTELEKQLEIIPDPLETEKVEKAAYENGRKTMLKELKRVEAVKVELEERLETTSIRLEEVEAELKACRENGSPPEPPPEDPPDSVTVYGTRFTKHLNTYYAVGDDITQTFWSYWHAQGREGKQVMRDAGWSVEKVDGNWEITIFPEDFQAWIENEESTTQPTSTFQEESSEIYSVRETFSSYAQSTSSEKITLPTSKEMEQPALEVLTDRREHRRVEIINHLTRHFSLTDDERSYLSKTGQVEKHLVKKGFIERTRTRYYRITPRGLQVLR